MIRPCGKAVGVHQVLGEAEQAAVRQAVLDHRPCDVGLSGQLWTRRLVGELIVKLYRVRLTEPGWESFRSGGGCPSSAWTSGPWNRTPGLWRAGIRGPGRRSARRRRPHLGREWQHARGAAEREPVLGARDVGDQHQGPDALHGLHRALHRRGDVPLHGTARRPRRPQGPPRGRRALRAPLEEGPGLARCPSRRRRAALPAAVLARAEPRRVGQCRTKHGLPKQHRARDQAEPAAETREPGAERSSTNTEHLGARYGSSIRSVWWPCRTQCTPPRQAITYAPSHE